MDFYNSEEPSAISVVVPAHNPGPGLMDCLSSLASLDYPSERLEVIVVDDCSSEDIVGVVSKHFPQFKMIRREENGGCDVARKDGILHSTGQIIAHTDADCTVCKDWARIIDRDIRAGARVVTGPVVHESKFWAQLIGISQFGHSQRTKTGRTSIFPGCNFAATREVLEKYEYKRESIRDGADRLLASRISSAGLPIIYDRRLVVNHYPPLEPRRVLKRWIHYAGVTYHIRSLDRRLPGARLLSLGPIAAFLLPAARLVRDYQMLISLAIARRVPVLLFAPLAVVFPLLRLLDVYGMLNKQLRECRDAT